MIRAIHGHLFKQNVEAVGGYTTDGNQWSQAQTASATETARSLRAHYLATALRQVLRLDSDSAMKVGDLLIPNATPTDFLKRLAGNTTATKKVLTQTGNGTISADPVWDSSSTGTRVLVSGAAKTLTDDTEWALEFGNDDIADILAEGTAGEMHNKTTNKTKLYAREAGIYLVTGSAKFVVDCGSGGFSGGIPCLLAIRQDGTTRIAASFGLSSEYFGTSVSYIEGSFATADIYLTTACLVSLAVDQFIELTALSDSGVTAGFSGSTQTVVTPYSFGMVKVGTAP